MSVELNSDDYETVLDIYQANLDSKAELSVQGFFNDLAEYKDVDFANMIVDAIKSETIINVRS